MGQSYGNLIMNAYALITAAGDQSADTNPFGDSTTPSLKLRESPLSLSYSGYYYWYSGRLNNRGSFGRYWGSTAYTSTDARYLYFNSTNVNPQNGYSKSGGLAVRCVAR